MTTQKNIFIHTFGCQMNVHDSEKILTLLSKEGYTPVDRPDQASVILMNTCSVREKPEQKVMSALGRYAILKEKNPKLIIGIGGCFARQEGKKLLKKAPVLDLVFGPDNIPEIPEMLTKIEEESQRPVEVEFDPVEDVRFLNVTLDILPSATSAMVTIMKGCDKYCSFCIVPYVRGRERFRPVHEILNEVQNLCQKGITEILLLGQSVTSYIWKEGEEVWDLARLLRALDKTKGLKRLRFTSPYPRDFSDALISCFGTLPTLCEHVHLPFQSGSNKILHKMNRRHTREQYFNWIDALRQRVSDIAITADVIVGFPGETEEDFKETMDLIEKVRFDQLYSFKYSPRPGTPATRKEQVSEEEKRLRLARLQERQQEIMSEKNKALIGQVVEVLVESSSQKEGQLKGRTRTHKIVNFQGDISLVGDYVKVQITEGYRHSLLGELVS